MPALPTPVRWSAPTPGLPPHLAHRLRMFSAPADAGAGASGAEAGAAAPAEQAASTTAATPADVAAQAAVAATQAATATGTWDGKVESLDPAVQKMITDLRGEAAASRTNAKATAAQEAEAALAQKIGQALGLVKDGDDAPKPEELTAQVATSQAAARAAQVELAVYKAATTAGADPQALLDSRSFLDAVKDADPADATAITAAITKAITDNPRLKATQAAARSGGDLAGGTGEGRSKTPMSLADAVSGAYAGA